ncbi:putative reverse transcriptase domain-containing protein, partial [Tanacetum coccineum]
MADDKSPSPDGFSAKFFKSAWSIVRNEGCFVVLDYFSNGKLLKEVNATIIALVPISHTPKSIADFRPIASCNDLYKCITKVIANKIKGDLSSIMSDNQCAFIPSRCEKVKLTHLCFTDDLMIFSKADIHFVKLLKSALDDFSKVSSLLPSMEKMYWSSVFILPKSINNDIKRLMRGFLWSHGDLKADKAKDSMWVKWVNSYRLIARSSNARNFWDIPILSEACWSWRKILQCRVVLKDHIVYRIGDGVDTLAWYGNWLFLGPLSKFISNRYIYEAGLSLDCKVANLVINGEWLCPEQWRINLGKFSVRNVRSDLIISKPLVPWFKVVWYSQNIPRHALMLWLAIHQKLKTQNRIERWMGVEYLKCSLCGKFQDSHSRLFFECEYSMKVWQSLKEMVRLDYAPTSLVQLVSYIARNLRFFQQKKRPVKVLCSIIVKNVRLRLTSLKIRGSKQSLDVADIWKIWVEKRNKDASCVFLEFVKNRDNDMKLVVFGFKQMYGIVTENVNQVQDMLRRLLGCGVLVCFGVLAEMECLGNGLFVVLGRLGVGFGGKGLFNYIGLSLCSWPGSIGLSECEATESNVRRIQVKDIVKEVEYYLKTYSSARMDIS